MTRGRSREQETEDVVPRRLKRGAIKRVHVAPWAIGRDELAPGVVDQTHLGPRSVNETHIHPAAAAAIAGGLSVTLTRPAAQTIAVNGSSIEFTEIDTGPRRHGITVTTPATSIVMPGSRIVSVLVQFAWSTGWRAGGTVSLLRDGVVVDSSPSSWGPRFSGVLHAGAVYEGEALSIVVDHGDAAPHDLEDVRAAFKVEGAPGTATSPRAAVAGIYNATIQTGAGLQLKRITADGSETLGSAALSVSDSTWYYIRASAVGQQIRAKAWAAADPEPVSWQVSVTDPDRLSPGFVGVSAGTASDGDRQYDTVAVSNDGGPWTETDFSEHATGAGLPSGWSQAAVGGTSWSIHEEAAATGGKVLRYVSDGTGSIAVWTTPGAGDDQEVLIRGRVTAGVALGVQFSANSLL